MADLTAGSAFIFLWIFHKCSFLACPANVVGLMSQISTELIESTIPGGSSGYGVCDVRGQVVWLGRLLFLVPWHSGSEFLPWGLHILLVRICNFLSCLSWYMVGALH